ncbi:Acyl-CoA-binding protein [Phaffia rhodozyma]|uniref:Acyl-CoA-binding protein n=1 Tax=Phaffia rhodozyma TaxID=264483 RepID=A0A0F7SH47_PHARH|nr:Acyl-CoA-binding protein [Phaffia rhodozyma]
MSAAQFDKAVAIVSKLPPTGDVRPSDDDKLIFYALFKQASVGDCNTPKPGLMDFVGKAKWNAWTQVKGKSTEDAKKEYVEQLKRVLSKASGNAEADAYLKELESA